MPSQIADPDSPMWSAWPVWRGVFDRRAAGFGKVDFLPREIASRMTQRLEYIKTAPQRILDAGCGPGADLAALTARYPEAFVTGADLSAGMLRLAKKTHSVSASRGVGGFIARLARGGREAGRIALTQADYASLPFADNAFDMIWSNLALQWHARPDQVFPEWQRTLAVGGLLMFSTLGPDTLKELRRAQTDAAAALARLAPLTPRPPAVLDFVDMHDFGDMLVASGFELPVMDMERLTLTYSEPATLLADVRAWGAFRRAAGRPANNAIAGPADAQERNNLPAGLGGRAARQALLDALEQQRGADGRLSLTFEIVYGHAWKAAPRHATPAHVRVEDIGGRRASRQ